MSATTDLHLLTDMIDAIAHGSLWPTSIRCETAAGRACQAEVEAVAVALRKAWVTDCVRRGRLSVALSRLEAERRVNEILTDRVLRLEGLPEL